MATSYAVQRIAYLASLATLCGPLLGCGDDGASTQPGSSSDASESSGPTGPSSSSPSSSSADTTSSATVDTSASSDSTGTAAIEVEVDITTYDSQPMVADLILTLSAPGTAVVSHATDAGVVVSPLPEGDETHLHFRARGLAPDTAHVLQFEVTPTDGGTPTDGEAGFDTPTALPAFVGGFVVEATDVDPAPLYRLADWNPFPFGDFAGAFMVDPAGITRWYLSEPTTLTGPPSVWVGVKLRDDGTILYLVGDTFYIRDELGNVLSEIPATELTGGPTQLGVLHHDVHELPNGNFMALSMSFADVDYADIGLTHVVGDVLVEFTPDGEIVWTWDSFDHLDPQRRRANFDDQLIDPLTGLSASDWTHANGFIYDEVGGTITLSMRHQDWIIQIDRASGDVLWRLGEDGDFTLADGERWFYHQHSPQWQPDGTLLLFDNGNGNPNLPPLEVFSRAVRFELDFDAMTASVAWQDDEPTLQVGFAGDADRIEGGHILVTDSANFGANGVYGRLRELEPEGDPERIWAMYTPDNRWIYRTTAHGRLVGQPLE